MSGTSNSKIIHIVLEKKPYCRSIVQHIKNPGWAIENQAVRVERDKRADNFPSIYSKTLLPLRKRR